MKFAKKILKWIFYILLIPVSYILISLVLSWITIERLNPNSNAEQSIYLGTNGVHLDIILPRDAVAQNLLTGLNHDKNDQYLSFGWGDENFYINTPTWSDLTFNNAFSAMFLKSTSLVHVTRYQSKRRDWVEVKVNAQELQKLNDYLLDTFKADEKGQNIRLKNAGYSRIDDFYKAKGSYSCFKTCNSWVNTAFKTSGLKSCLWTPFDFGLLDKYK